MEMYLAGPDSLTQDELGQIPGDRLWVVVWYLADDYEGSGWAAALRPDGNIEHKSLSHCSCYGPMDGDWSVVSVEEFLTYDVMDHAMPSRERTANDYDKGTWVALVSKVREVVYKA